MGKERFQFDFVPRALRLADAEEELRDADDGRDDLVERAVADDVRVVIPVRGGKIAVLLHGVAQAVGRSKTKGKTAA